MDHGEGGLGHARHSAHRLVSGDRHAADVTERSCDCAETFAPRLPNRESPAQNGQEGRRRNPSHAMNPGVVAPRMRALAAEGTAT